MRDPFILEANPGEYVLFGTTDENLWGGPGTGFDCYTSSDLADWSGPYSAFRPEPGFWATTQFWAPEVHAYGERYFMLATMASTPAPPERMIRGTVVLVADKPTGPFISWSDGPVTPVEVPCLDGTLFIDDNQTPWIIYSRGAEGIPGGAPGIADGEMYARQLTADLKQPAGEPVLLFHSSAAPWSKPLWFPPGVEPPEQLNLAKDPLFTDGAFLIRGPHGKLFMLWSAFGEAGYAMGVATSESGNILGPWVQNPKPLWPLNGGHGMILHDSGGKNYLVFHAPNDTPNERVQMVEVLINTDGLELLQDTL